MDSSSKPHSRLAVSHNASTSAALCDYCCWLQAVLIVRLHWLLRVLPIRLTFTVAATICHQLIHSRSSSRHILATWTAAMSRYYVHTATTVPAAQQHTFVYKPDTDSATIQQLVDAFITDYHTTKQQHIAVDKRDDAVTNAAGDRLKFSDAVSTRLEDRDDIFLAVHTTTPPPTTTTPATSIASSTSAAATKGKVAAAVKREHSEKERELFSVLEAATKQFNDNKLNRALTLYNHILSDAAATQSQHDDIRALRRTALSQSAAIHYNCQRYTEARDRLNKAIALLSLTYRLPPAEGGKAEKEREEARLEEAELFALLARCHIHLKDWEEAELAISTAIERLAPLKTNSKASERNITNRRQDYQVLHIRVMYECGDERRKREAVALIERLISANDQHVPSLTYYAQIAVDSGNGVAVIPYLLRAVVNLQQQKGKEVDSEVSAHTHALFARMVSLPAGLTTLLDGLGHAAKMPSSLCFLAQTLKDHSAVTAAIGLYRRALQITRSDDEERVSVWLSLVHTLEVLMQYEEAWKELRQWLQEDRAREVAGVPLQRVWDVVKAIDTLAYDDSMLADKSTKCAHWSSIPPLFDEGDIQVAIPTPAASSAAAATSSTSSSMVPAHKHIPAALTSAIKPHPLYPPATLNRLAMMFTMAKLMFVNGVLQPIPALVALLEPTRERKVTACNNTAQECPIDVYSVPSRCCADAAFPPLSVLAVAARIFTSLSYATSTRTTPLSPSCAATCPTLSPSCLGCRPSG